MNIRATATYLGLAILFAGCATPYQPMGFTGGYADTQLAPDVFRVSFSGNGATSSDRAQDFALLRAAEICLTHGYKYFAVISAADQSRTQLHVMPGSSYTTGSVTGFGSMATYSGTTSYSPPQIYNIHKPGLGLIVRGFGEKPDNMNVFDGEFLIKALRTKYQIP